MIKDIKIYTNGKSKEIQEKLFDLGARWVGETQHIILYEDKPFLYVNKDKIISHGTNMTTFKGHSAKEISLDDLLKMKPPTQLDGRGLINAINEKIKSDYEDATDSEVVEAIWNLSREELLKIIG